MEIYLVDKNGNKLFNDCLIYGGVKNVPGVHYFNLRYNANNKSLEMIACTYGYVHNVTQKDVQDCVLIGPAIDNLHLLDCD